MCSTLFDHMPSHIVQVSRQFNFAAALDLIVRRDIERFFFRGTPPPVGADTHAFRTMQLTLSRHRFTRAALERESPSGMTGEFGDLCNELQRMLNGDWRKPYLQHFCIDPHCCGGGNVEVCIAKVSALLHAVLLARLGERVPSSHRWHTVAPALEVQAFGMLCHSILPRMIELAGASTNAVTASVGADENSTDAFIAYRAKKDTKCREFMQAADSPPVVALAVIVSEPVEHLSARLRRLDYAGHS
jgi:hypothetical protein